MCAQFDFITPIKDQLEKGLHEHCQLFMLIGRKHETPRFYNCGDHDFNDMSFKINSTQNSNLFFTVIAPDKNYFRWLVTNKQMFWTQFKIFRTEFLTKNYPTINPY